MYKKCPFCIFIQRASRTNHSNGHCCCVFLPIRGCPCWSKKMIYFKNGQHFEIPERAGVSGSQFMTQEFKWFWRSQCCHMCNQHQPFQPSPPLRAGIPRSHSYQVITWGRSCQRCWKFWPPLRISRCRPGMVMIGWLANVEKSLIYNIMLPLL